MKHSLQHMLRLVIASCLLASATGCVTQINDRWGQPIMERSGVYTLTNLHTNRGRGARMLSTLNYVGGDLLPRCSEVYLENVNEDNLVFNRNGQRHHFRRNRHTPESFHHVIRNYFGTRCSDSELADLGPLDRDGIASGKVGIGMSKQGVIYAWGYPPTHATPDLSSNKWIYWLSRSNRVAIHFDHNERVKRVQN